MAWRGLLGFFWEKCCGNRFQNHDAISNQNMPHVFRAPKSTWQKVSFGFVSGFFAELVSWELKGLDNVCTLVAPLKFMSPFLKSPGNYRVGKLFPSKFKIEASIVLNSLVTILIITIIIIIIIIIIIYFLLVRKLTSEYDQMRLTTITICNNYNKVYLRIPQIYNLKFINLTITGKSLPK